MFGNSASPRFSRPRTKWHSTWSRCPLKRWVAAITLPRWEIDSISSSVGHVLADNSALVRSIARRQRTWSFITRRVATSACHRLHWLITYHLSPGTDPGSTGAGRSYKHRFFCPHRFFGANRFLCLVFPYFLSLCRALD